MNKLLYVFATFYDPQYEMWNIKYFHTITYDNVFYFIFFLYYTYASMYGS